MDRKEAEGISDAEQPHGAKEDRPFSTAQKGDKKVIHGTHQAEGGRGGGEEGEEIVEDDVLFSVPIDNGDDSPHGTDEEDDKVAAVIRKFGNIYRKEQTDLEAFLTCLRRHCEDLIRGKYYGSVTSRVKSWTSLRGKLKNWHASSQKSHSAIEDLQKYVNILKEDNDLDIIGLRIRAYFPKQQEEICQIIRNSFCEIKDPKPFTADYKDKDRLPDYDEKFGNYEGFHYWLRLKPGGSLPGLPQRLQKKFKDQCFEIQVRSSTLLDGWAEVRHDITYKTLGGKPDRAERVLLDVMKGTVKSMEALLDHLLEVHEQRMKDDETKFDTMDLFEQSLFHVLPQLSRSNQNIEDVQVLHRFIKAVSIETSGQFKEAIRRSQFAQEFDGFMAQRALSQQPIWTFILRHVFVTLSEANRSELINKLSGFDGLHQIFCRSLSLLDKYLFRQDHASLEERERCNVIWDLHEYICATWPNYKSTLPALLEKLFASIIETPVSRVDTSLFVAVAEMLYGSPYEPEEDLMVADYEHDTAEHLFRRHRHDALYENFSTPGSITNTQHISLAARLLNIRIPCLCGALLHRAVCHQEEEGNLTIVRQLIDEDADTNINCVNHAGQSTLQIATIFAPTIDTLELLFSSKYGEGLDLNHMDHGGETALMAASALRRKDFIEFLLSKSHLNVNLRGTPSHEVQAMKDWNAKRDKSWKLLCQSATRGVPGICFRLDCPCEKYSIDAEIRRSLTEWYVRAKQWSELESVVEHISFDALENFYTWKSLLECFTKAPSSIQDLLKEEMEVSPNELDEQGKSLLGAVLRLPNLEDRRLLVDHLVHAGAKPTLHEPGERDHMLTTTEDMESFRALIPRPPADLLAPIDSHGRNLLHYVARGQQYNYDWTRGSDIHTHYDSRLTEILNMADADQFRCDLQGRTWIHHAVLCDAEVDLSKIFESRLTQASDQFRQQLNAPDNDGWTPLHWVCLLSCQEWCTYLRTYRSEEVENRIQFLCRNGADPDRECNRGWTPRRILALLGGQGFQNLALPPASDDSLRVDSAVPSAVRKAFERFILHAENIESYDSRTGVVYRERAWRGADDVFGTGWSGCHGCLGAIEHTYLRYKCRDCPAFFCFKCGWTMETTHPGHRFTDFGTCDDEVTLYLDNL